MRLLRRSSVSLDFLVAGLGNPGKRYSRSPHNVGFMVIEELARRNDVSMRSKFSGQVGDLSLGSSRLVLLKPMTYMNDSGRSVSPAMRFFKLSTEALLLVHDDVDLGLGRIQIRAGGGFAGHKGLRSIATHIGSSDFLRVRVGVGRPSGNDYRSVSDYVLSPFASGVNVEEIVVRAADAVESIVCDGFEEAQLRHNGEVSV